MGRNRVIMAINKRKRAATGRPSAAQLAAGVSAAIKDRAVKEEQPRVKREKQEKKPAVVKAETKRDQPQKAVPKEKEQRKSKKAAERALVPKSAAEKREAEMERLATQEWSPSKKGYTHDGSHQVARADSADEVVLLGHIISHCVGIQHYHNNGHRYNKEPLILRREPNNPYDANAVGAYATVGGKLRQVGHVPRHVALSLAYVADDRAMGIRMIGSIEGGAGQVRTPPAARTARGRHTPPPIFTPATCTQVYKFPLRISFFGHAKHFARVDQRLQNLGGPALIRPKPRKSSAGGGGGRGAASSSASARAGDSDDDVVCVGEKTWEQRDAELRAKAVVLE